MRVVTWTIRLAVFVVLIAFGARNTDPVTLRFYFDLAWQMPLIVVLLRRVRAGRAVRRGGAPRHAVSPAPRDLASQARQPARASRRSGRPRRPQLRPRCRRSSHGVRILVAARLPAVLRPGLDGRAHRHPPDRIGVARAAALVLQGAQLPAERAAGQGDRGVHRGGEGRPGRPSSCTSRSAASSAAAASTTARSACTSTSSSAPDLGAEQKVIALVRARPGLPQGGHPRPRRGGVQEARGHAAVRGRAAGTCSRSTSRRRSGSARSR